MSTEVANGDKPETTIQTSVCEAYIKKPGSDYYINQVGQLVLGNGHRGMYYQVFATVHVDKHFKLEIEIH